MVSLLREEAVNDTEENPWFPSVTSLPFTYAFRLAG
jgi:hypothetical protein